VVNHAVIAPNAPYKSILVCPACQGQVVMDPAEMRCLDCEQVYQPASAGAQLDLRLRHPKEVTTCYTPASPGAVLEPDAAQPIAPAPNPACPGWDSIALTDEITYGNRLTRTMLSHFPAAEDRDAWMLDLGCGDRRFEPLCRSLTGFNYVGIDFDGREPDLLADAHALPFRDETFSFILSVAVLEHLAAPAVAMAEVARVLKPGGAFIGTVAFLEPFHMLSHFHMTHVGLARLLDDAGFDIVAMEANNAWTGLRAQAEMALFPGLNGMAQRAMVALPDYASDGLAAAKRVLRGGSRGPDTRRLETTGGFRFVARRRAKPPLVSTPAGAG
jgi:SAM-dependent methyltransferase